MTVYVEINMDYVKINGQRVNRPSSVSRSDWLAWWEDRL